MSSTFGQVLLDQTPDAVILTTRDGKIAYWNSSAAAIFDYSSAEAVGRSLQELIVPPDEREQEEKIFQEVITTGFRGEATFAGRAGGAIGRDPVAVLRVWPDEMAVLGARTVFLPNAVNQQSHDFHLLSRNI